MKEEKTPQKAKIPVELAVNKPSKTGSDMFHSIMKASVKDNPKLNNKKNKPTK
jgi:hypothetical protein